MSWQAVPKMCSTRTPDEAGEIAPGNRISRGEKSQSLWVKWSICSWARLKSSQSCLNHLTELSKAQMDHDRCAKSVLPKHCRMEQSARHSFQFSWKDLHTPVSLVTWCQWTKTEMLAVLLDKTWHESDFQTAPPKAFCSKRVSFESRYGITA